MKNFKKLVMMLFFMLVFSCNKTSSPEILEMEQSSRFDIDNIPEGLEEDIISSYEMLIKNSSEVNFNKFKKKLKEKYGIDDNLEYDTFVSMKDMLLEAPSKNKKLAVNNLFSESAVKVIEEMRDILSQSQDKKSFDANIEKCFNLLKSSKKVNSDEANFLVLKLKLIKSKATKENANAKIGEVYKCKWYQWGCVLYTSTVQLPILSAWCSTMYTNVMDYNSVIGNGLHRSLLSRFLWM